MVKIFVTMSADPDMQMRAWGHAVEELTCLVAQAVTESEWKDTVIYGPDSGTFSFYPNLCIEARLPAQVVVGLRETIAQSPWFGVPVTVSIAQKTTAP